MKHLATFLSFCLGVVSIICVSSPGQTTQPADTVPGAVIPAITQESIDKLTRNSGLVYDLTTDTEGQFFRAPKLDGKGQVIRTGGGEVVDETRPIPPKVLGTAEFRTEVNAKAVILHDSIQCGAQLLTRRFECQRDQVLTPFAIEASGFVDVNRYNRKVGQIAVEGGQIRMTVDGKEISNVFPSNTITGSALLRVAALWPTKSGRIGALKYTTDLLEFDRVYPPLGVAAMFKEKVWLPIDCERGVPLDWHTQKVQCSRVTIGNFVQLWMDDNGLIYKARYPESLVLVLKDRPSTQPTK